ncbi:hypothetical protein GF327_03565 [Candidatus Woesearchaeota archaeon]|nr:hypothetical protein [Candidatus Woesearchaeota archaeon]
MNNYITITIAVLIAIAGSVFLMKSAQKITAQAVAKVNRVNSSDVDPIKDMEIEACRIECNFKAKQDLCRDRCFLRVASAYKNRDYCDLINKVSTKKDCLRIVGSG